jgi:transcriptional regulator with XRE-family HTH domain
MIIVERIKQLMHDNELSAAAFADTIGVQRSSISHILSERNKPSLDFILKILHAYPSVSVEWLLKGVKSKNAVVTPARNQEDFVTIQEDLVKPDENSVPKSTPSENIIHKSTTSKQVERIIVCYNDGTSSTYLNKN